MEVCFHLIECSSPSYVTPSLPSLSQVSSMPHLSDDAGGSTIYIYALKQGGDGTISAVDSGDIEG